MKVSIFGSYNGSSIGDTAILLGLISSIFRVLGDDVEITVITFGSIGINEELAELGIKKRVKEISANRGFPDYSYGIGELLNRSWRYVKRIQRKSILNEGRVREGLRGSDILLIGGGNLVMDLYESWPRALMSVCNVSNNLHIPYGFIGVGSAPINTAQGKKNLLASLELSSGVCFRDSASKEYCAEHLKFYRSSVGPDLAFGIECPSVTQTDKADVLLVNLAGVYSECWPVKDQDKYSAYLSNMVDVVDRLVESLSIKELVVFNTNYPLDEIASEDFLNKYRDSSRAPVPLSLVRGRHTVASLLRICSQAKYSLVTRLHAGIISKIAGARVFAIEYQPKVRNVLQNQTSNTTVESFDSVIAGTAFHSVDASSVNEKSKGDFVDMNEVDKLVSLFLNAYASREI